MPKPRRLNFRSLDEVMPEVDRLLAGHAVAGRWSLGQICSHLCAALYCTMHGFPPWRANLVVSVLRPFARWYIFRYDRLIRGFPLPRQYHPRPGQDARALAESLRGQLAEFLTHDGPLHPHPQLGPFTRAQWLRFHAIHCAHHLGFVIPVS